MIRRSLLCGCILCTEHLAPIIALHALRAITRTESLTRAAHLVPRRPDLILTVGIRVSSTVGTEESVTRDFQAAKGIDIAVPTAGRAVAGFDVCGNAAGSRVHLYTFAIWPAWGTGAVSCESRLCEEREEGEI